MKGRPENSFLEQFSERFMDHVRQVCTFAKLIPGFKCLHHDDQVTLLKSCVFEVLLVRLAGLFENQVRGQCIAFCSVNMQSTGGQATFSKCDPDILTFSMAGRRESRGALFTAREGYRQANRRGALEWFTLSPLLCVVRQRLRSHCSHGACVDGFGMMRLRCGCNL